MNFYLIRHGETDWNKEGRMQGHIDIPMNAEGIRQSEQVGSRLREMLLCAEGKDPAELLIVSSPLKRAKMCAEIIADKLAYAREKIQTEPLFIERSFGKSEGEIWQADMREHEQENQWESMESLVERARAGVEKYIKQEDQTVIIVAHGAILKTVLAVLADESIAHGDNSNAVKQGSIVAVGHEQGKMKHLKETSVLEEG